MNINFKLEILANFEFFGGIKFVNKLFIKLLNFVRIFNKNRNGKVKITIIAWLKFLPGLLLIFTLILFVY